MFLYRWHVHQYLMSLSCILYIEKVTSIIMHWNRLDEYTYLFVRYYYARAKNLFRIYIDVSLRNHDIIYEIREKRKML